MACTVREVSQIEVNDELTAAIAHLASLITDGPLPTVGDMGDIINRPGTRLLVACDANEQIIGMATVVIMHIPTGYIAQLHNLVVLKEYRQQGVGLALGLRALEVAAGNRARLVDCTAQVTKEPAKRLLAKLGFQLRPTNAYRLELDQSLPE